MENRDVDPASPHPGIPAWQTFAPGQGEPPAAAPAFEHMHAAADGRDDVSETQATAPPEQRPDTVGSDRSTASTEISALKPDAAVTPVADGAIPSGPGDPLPELPGVIPVALPAAVVSCQAAITAIAESSTSISVATPAAENAIAPKVENRLAEVPTAIPVATPIAAGSGEAIIAAIPVPIAESSNIVPVAIPVAEKSTTADVASPLPETASVLQDAIPVAAVCDEAIIPVSTPVAENAIATEVAGPLAEFPIAITVAMPLAAVGDQPVISAIAVPVALPIAAVGGQPIISAIAVPVADSSVSVAMATPAADGSGLAGPIDAGAAKPVSQAPVTRPFDPWHKWLGVHPSEQPPHYYRLLGLMPFEDDAEVIETVADRQIAYITQRAAGPHGDFVPPVLNSLSAARACLLAPVQKAAYDIHLKQRLSPRPAPQSGPMPEWNPAPKPALGFEPQSPATTIDFGAVPPAMSPALSVSPVVALPSEPRRMKMREQDSPVGVIVAAVFGGICAFGLYFLYEWYMNSRRAAPRRRRAAVTCPTMNIVRVQATQSPAAHMWPGRDVLETSTHISLADAPREQHFRET